MTEELAKTLITLGSLFLLGLVTDLLGRRTPLPRVTLLLVIGFLIGPSGLDVLPDLSEKWFPLLADMALVMIGFLLGGIALLRKQGHRVLWISCRDCTHCPSRPNWITAFRFSGIATATDPAATIDVAREVKAKGPFTRTLLGIVAVDDA